MKFKLENAQEAESFIIKYLSEKAAKIETDDDYKIAFVETVLLTALCKSIAVTSLFQEKEQRVEFIKKHVELFEKSLFKYFYHLKDDENLSEVDKPIKNIQKEVKNFIIKDQPGDCNKLVRGLSRELSEFLKKRLESFTLLLDENQASSIILTSLGSVIGAIALSSERKSVIDKVNENAVWVYENNKKEK